MYILMGTYFALLYTDVNRKDHTGKWKCSALLKMTGEMRFNELLHAEGGCRSVPRQLFPAVPGVCRPGHKCPGASACSSPYPQRLTASAHRPCPAHCRTALLPQLPSLGACCRTPSDHQSCSQQRALRKS